MLKKIALGFAILIGGLAALFGAAFAYAQSGIARGQIQGLIEERLSDQQQTAEVQGLAGLLPFDIRLGRFRLSDDQGTWLEVDDVRVQISPRDLLAGRIVVRELGAERIAIPRLPETMPAAAESEPTPDGGFELPRLPERLPVVAAERLYVNRIELGAPVAGQPAVFKLEGGARTGPEGNHLDARLDLTRLDQPTASANLAADVDLAARNAQLRLRAEETGGLLAGLTERPEAGAFHLDLDGSGPLSDWRATLRADAERLLSLDADLGLAVDGPPRIDLTGKLVSAEGVLPAEVAELVGQELDVRVRGGQQDPNLVTLDELRIAGGGFSLTGQGRAELRANTIDGRIDLAVPSLEAASGLAGRPLAGSAGLSIAATGAAMQPSLVVSLDGRQIRADPVSVGELTSRLDVTFLGPLDQGYAGVRVAGQGGATALMLDGEPLRPEDAVTFDLAATVPATGPAALDHLRLAGQRVQAQLGGTFDRETLAGQGRAEATVSDLAALVAALGPMAPPGLTPEGALALAADVTVEEQARRIQVDLSGSGERLAGLPPGAQELLGGRLSLAAKAAIEPGQRANVESLSLEGAGVRLTGTAGMALADRSLTGDLRLALPDLAVLAPVAQQPLAGRLEARAQLAGTIERPALTLDAMASDLHAADRTFERVALQATAQGAPEDLAGDLRLAVTQAEGELTLATAYRLMGERLGVSGLRLEGPATSITGDLDVDLAADLATGRLAGGVSDLAALKPWHQQNLTGKVDLAADLSAPEGRQNASLTLDASGITGEFGTLTDARVRANVRDAFGAMALDGEAVVDGFAQPGLTVEQARVTARGSLADLQVAAEARGQQVDRFDVATRARLMLAEEAKRVELQSLGGTFAGQTIELRAPATLVLDRGVLDLDQLDLRIGQARIQGSIDMGQGRVRAAARLSDFDLALLEPFGAPALQGRAEGEMSLSGPTRSPAGTLRLEVPALTPGAGAPSAMPAVAVNVTARLEGGQLAADLRVEDLAERPITGSVTLPVQFALEPLSFDVPENGALSGRVDGGADLARIGALAQLDGQRLGGRLDAALRLGGTVAAPDVGGQVRITDGLVEDAVSGALFQDIALVATGADRRIVIERLTARDRASGTLSARGEVDFGAAGAVPYRVETSLQRAEVMRNDLGSATLSGDVRVGGDLRRATIDGRLVVDRADLGIPDAGGTTIPAFPVEEVYDGQVQPIAARPAATPFEADLDVTVDIPARLFVRGRGLDSEWGGNLAVRGSASAPEITGRLEYRRGFVDLLDRRFQVRTGQIIFDGGTVPNLDIEAAAQGEALLAIVKILGPANRPRLEITSEPSLPQDEILAQLLFGRDVRQITPVQGLRLAAAVSALEGGGTDLVGDIRSRLGLDTLDVGTDVTGQSTARAGRYLSDNVYLELQRGLTTGTNAARVEVQLTPSISLNTQVGDQGQTAVGVDWKIDY